MPRSIEDLTLPEQILLLALRDEKGTVAFQASMYSYALGGAILAELALAGRVRIGEEKKHVVEAAAAEALGDPLLEECRAAVAGTARPRAAKAWVARFARIRRLKHRVAEALCAKGILRNEDDQVLLIFTRKIYPVTDPTPEQLLVERMREAIFGESEKLDTRTALVVALAHAADLLPIHFPKKELKRRKQRLEAIVDGEAIGGATRAVVQAVKTAVIAAVAASSASHRH